MKSKRFKATNSKAIQRLIKEIKGLEIIYLCKYCDEQITKIGVSDECLNYCSNCNLIEGDTYEKVH